MTRSLLLLFCLLSLKTIAQRENSKIARAFPITDYTAKITDSIQAVQVYLPDDTIIHEKQLGLLRGMYRDKHADTAIIGTGRCNLIKGDYYYFTINYAKSGRLPQRGDLLRTMVDRPKVYYHQVVKLASNFIALQNVYERPLYDRYHVFKQWNEKDEALLVDSVIADIHFTGNYFLENSPGMNIPIKGGKYDGKMVLNIMKACDAKDVTDFFDYMIVRPHLYAGREWKIAEIFATWLSQGAPTVIK